MTEDEKKELHRKKRFDNYVASCALEGMGKPQLHFTTKYGINLKGVKLVLGEMYHIAWGGRMGVICKLIQVTPYGYNLLNLDTNRCILDRHLYVPKKLRDKFPDEEKFFITSDHLQFITPQEHKQRVIEYYKWKAKKDSRDKQKDL